MSELAAQYPTTRRYPRYSLKGLPGFYLNISGKKYQLKNLSLGGSCIEWDKDFPQDQFMDQFALIEMECLGLTFPMDMMVRYAEEGLVGLAFDEQGAGYSIWQEMIQVVEKGRDQDKVSRDMSLSFHQTTDGDPIRISGQVQHGSGCTIHIQWTKSGVCCLESSRDIPLSDFEQRRLIRRIILFGIGFRKHIDHPGYIELLTVAISNIEA